MSPRVRIPPCPPSPQPSSRAGAMAFKGGGMRTLVRAHDEVPCITAIIPPRNPEEDFCTSAQPERSECNPAVWGRSKRVRQPRPTPPYGDSQRESGNRGPPSRMAPTCQRRKLANQHSLSGARAPPSSSQLSRTRFYCISQAQHTTPNIPAIAFKQTTGTRTRRIPAVTMNKKQY